MPRRSRARRIRRARTAPADRRRSPRSTFLTVEDRDAPDRSPPPGRACTRLRGRSARGQNMPDNDGTALAIGSRERAGRGDEGGRGSEALDLTRAQILAFRRQAGGWRAAGPWAGFASPRRLGRAAGQHAPGRAAVDPRAGRGDRASHLGGPFAGPALGPAVQRLRGRRPRPRRLLAGDAARRRQGPPQGRRPRRPPARCPRRRADELRRGGPRARRAPQQAAVRGRDRHGRHPLGRRAAGRPSGPCRRPQIDSPRRPAGTHPPVPARLRPGHAGVVRPVGRDRSRGRPSRRSRRSPRR